MVKIKTYQRVARFRHHGSCLHEQLTLVIGIVSTSVGNVVQYIIASKLIPFGNSQQSFGSECTWNCKEDRNTKIQILINWFAFIPSVSMYKHFPSPPPMSTGNWQVTAKVWQSWLLPVRNSPNNSVIDPVSMPPWRSLSNSLEPVVICNFKQNGNRRLRMRNFVDNWQISVMICKWTQNLWLSRQKERKNQ